MDKPRSIRAKLNGIGFVLAGLLACTEGPGAPPPPPPPPPPPAPQNAAPVANAGLDLTVSAGLAVALDGAASSDADGDRLTYIWSFASVPTGSTAALDDDASATPSFTPDVAGDYVLQLVVNDGTDDSPTDQATVTAQDNTATRTIGAGGGDITSSDGRAVLSIPVGALSADTEIRITKWMPDQYLDEWKGFSDQALVYNFAPDGTQFVTPARLTVTTNAPAVNEDGDVEAQLGVLVDLVGGVGEPLANLVTEADGAENRITVSGDVAHFSDKGMETIVVQIGGPSANLRGLIVRLDAFDRPLVNQDFATNVEVEAPNEVLDFLEVTHENLSDPGITPKDTFDPTFTKIRSQSVPSLLFSNNVFKFGPDPGPVTLLTKVTLTFRVPADQKIAVGGVIVSGNTYTKEIFLSRTITGLPSSDAKDFVAVTAPHGERLARTLLGEEEVVGFGRSDGFTVVTKDGDRIIDADADPSLQVDFFGGSALGPGQLLAFGPDGVFALEQTQSFPPVADLVDQKLAVKLVAALEEITSATDITVYSPPGSEGAIMSRSEDGEQLRSQGSERAMVSRFEAGDFLFLDSDLELTEDPSIFDDDQGESVFGDKGPISGYVSPNGFTENDPMLAVLVDPVTKDTQLDVVTLATDQGQRRAVSTKAFDLQGEGRMVRCLDGICAASSRGTGFGFGGMTYFKWDGQNDPVFLQSLLGRANGIDLVSDGNGNVMVASTNIDASLVNVMVFDTDGTLLGSASEPAPEGCTRPEHTVFRPAPQGGVPTEVLLMCSEEEIQATAFTIVNF